MIKMSDSCPFSPDFNSRLKPRTRKGDNHNMHCYLIILPEIKFKSILYATFRLVKNRLYTSDHYFYYIICLFFIFIILHIMDQVSKLTNYLKINVKEIDLVEQN